MRRSPAFWTTLHFTSRFSDRQEPVLSLQPHRRVRHTLSVVMPVQAHPPATQLRNSLVGSIYAFKLHLTCIWQFLKKNRAHSPHFAVCFFKIRRGSWQVREIHIFPVRFDGCVAFHSTAVRFLNSRSRVPGQLGCLIFGFVNSTAEGTLTHGHTLTSARGLCRTVTAGQKGNSPSSSHAEKEAKDEEFKAPCLTPNKKFSNSVPWVKVENEASRRSREKTFMTLWRVMFFTQSATSPRQKTPINWTSLKVSVYQMAVKTSKGEPGREETLAVLLPNTGLPSGV